MKGPDSSSYNNDTTILVRNMALLFVLFVCLLLDKANLDFQWAGKHNELKCTVSFVKCTKRWEFTSEKVAG